MTETRAPSFRESLRSNQEAERIALWQAIRDAGDVYEANGYWMLTSPEAVQFAQRNPDVFSVRDILSEFELPVRLIPGAIDPPEHRDLRKVLDPLLGPKAVGAIEDELRVRAGELVDAFADRGHCDAIRELAVPFPTSVFLTVFGLPGEDREHLTELVETIIENAPQTSPETTDLAFAAMDELHRYLRAHVEEKRRHPSGGGDMLGSILALEGDEAWSDDDVVGMCVLLVMAGLDTVAGASGHLLLHLGRDRELRRRVLDDRSLLPALIEEVLRLDPPVPVFPRTTTEEVEVCGVRIPAGAKVMLWLACANREADRHGEPDRIDLDQAGRTHVTFGGGVHRCLGSHLARRELRLLAEAFLDRIPEFEVEPGFVPTTAWPKGTLHLHSLPLRFPVATAMPRPPGR